MKFAEQDVVQLVESIWASFLNENVTAVAGEPSPRDDDELIGTVSIAGSWNGVVLLRCPRETIAEATGRIFGQTGSLPHDLVSDTLGELTNVVAGNLKALLPGSCTLGLPSVSTAHRIPDSSVCIHSTSFHCGIRQFGIEVYERKLAV